MEASRISHQFTCFSTQLHGQKHRTSLAPRINYLLIVNHNSSSI